MVEIKHLFYDYYLDNDRLNYIVCQRVVNKRGKSQGKEAFVNHYYFSNVKAVRKHLIELYSIQNILNVEFELFISQLDEVLKKIEKLNELPRV